MKEQIAELPLGREEDADSGDLPTTASHTPFLEWLIGIVGFLLVAGAITFLLYQGLAGNPRPPEILLQVDSIQAVGAQYLVRVRATNQGGETVKGLVIEGSVKPVQGEKEISTLTFDYVPAQSERIGGLFFTTDPRGRAIQLRAQGYEQP